jgi:hypothetical protein
LFQVIISAESLVAVIVSSFALAVVSVLSFGPGGSPHFKLGLFKTLCPSLWQSEHVGCLFLAL